ncbi:S-adenosylmethionine:tRNA ribosyltransferase-isomerase [Paenibacillus sp.]|jgi:S-adenosylmethionine:tRNA ribosyltransferase-isomerase|uniref:S-adenosylmethionine:tRNA ribosyltransferase-isomerase n=1 Tax=Paenibacillus sp. TaxID=58172 RepID=UPI0028354458|nr:S-adenosylmethionine:tRNA ribosyltransferase-isomerase [Paenibacillus sp.]MDR0268663.1 S-adenosylmethionine:tRNA ribosyltransferase-isomerase [Paenibacillus sp.]
MMASEIEFDLPDSLNASEPPERRGVRRDHVKMMVLNRKNSHILHDDFFSIDQYLHKGDVVVLNNSRTIPAVLKTMNNIEIRLSRKRGKATWDALIMGRDVKLGDTFEISECLNARVIAKVPSLPFWTLEFSKEGYELYDEIYKNGEPVRYEYIDTPWGMDYYQTVYASVPGSVEMPSAGRAFSWELLSKLQKKGVHIVFLQLHAGLSYFMDDNWGGTPLDCNEPYHIPLDTMETICQAKATGRRVVAIGTTVVRALETAAMNAALSGWTNLYIQKQFPLQIVDGILTGFHEPRASHLDMLSAFIDSMFLFKAYEEAIEHRYLWHEFGDVHLII